MGAETGKPGPTAETMAETRPAVEKMHAGLIDRARQELAEYPGKIEESAAQIQAILKNVDEHFAVRPVPTPTGYEIEITYFSKLQTMDDLKRKLRSEVYGQIADIAGSLTHSGETVRAGAEKSWGSRKSVERQLQKEQPPKLNLWQRLTERLKGLVQRKVAEQAKVIPGEPDFTPGDPRLVQVEQQGVAIVDQAVEQEQGVLEQGKVEIGQLLKERTTRFADSRRVELVLDHDISRFIEGIGLMVASGDLETAQTLVNVRLTRAAEIKRDTEEINRNLQTQLQSPGAIAPEGSLGTIADQFVEKNMEAEYDLSKLFSAREEIERRISAKLQEEATKRSEQPAPGQLAPEKHPAGVR